MPRKLSLLVAVLGAAGLVVCVLLGRSSTRVALGLAFGTAPAERNGEQMQSARIEGGDRADGAGASTGRSPASFGANAEGASRPFATFSYSDGTPAAGLGVCSATALSVSEIEICAGPAVWAEHLDERGGLAGDVARKLGSLVDVRLSSCSLQVMRLLPPAGRHYVLPNVGAQAFRLSKAPPGVSAQFLIKGRDLVRCGSAVEYVEQTQGTEFADRFRVTAIESVQNTLVLAFARGELSSEKPSIEVSLPAGTYEITPLTCSVGWWFDGFRAEADGRSIDIALHQVPVSTVMLPSEPSGKLRQPTDARILVASHDPRFSGSSGEVRLPWRVEGDRILVSLTYRDTGDERYTTYALKIYWSDGTDSTTGLGSWEALLGTLAFDR